MLTHKHIAILSKMITLRNNLCHLRHSTIPQLRCYYCKSENKQGEKLGTLKWFFSPVIFCFFISTLSNCREIEAEEIFILACIYQVFLDDEHSLCSLAGQRVKLDQSVVIQISFSHVLRKQRCLFCKSRDHHFSSCFPLLMLKKSPWKLSK